MHSTKTRTANLLAAAERIPGDELPKAYRVGRCASEPCAKVYAWKGSAPRPACPACGTGLAATTRRVKYAPFIVLTDELLTIAELEAEGLEASAQWHDDRAASYDEQRDEYRAELAAGDLVPWPHDPASYFHTPGRSTLVRVGFDAFYTELAAKERAKAAKARARRAKLAATLEAPEAPAPAADLDVITRVGRTDWVVTDDADLSRATRTLMGAHPGQDVRLFTRDGRLVAEYIAGA